MLKLENLKDWARICVGIVVTILILAIFGIFIGIFTSLSIFEGIRITIGSFYVLFLPGFVISWIFFPKTKKFEDDGDKNNKRELSAEKGVIDWIERIALSFALSIAIVPLAVFYLNLIGIRINTLNSFFTILSIILVSLGILYLKSKRQS